MFTNCEREKLSLKCQKTCKILRSESHNHRNFTRLKSKTLHSFIGGFKREKISCTLLLYCKVHFRFTKSKYPLTFVWFHVLIWTPTYESQQKRYNERRSNESQNKFECVENIFISVFFVYFFLVSLFPLTHLFCFGRPKTKKAIMPILPLVFVASVKMWTRAEKKGVEWLKARVHNSTNWFSLFFIVTTNNTRNCMGFISYRSLSDISEIYK